MRGSTSRVNSGYVATFPCHDAIPTWASYTLRLAGRDGCLFLNSYVYKKTEIVIYTCNQKQCYKANA